MFIPLHDANSLKYIKLQYVTIGLIAANVIVFILTSLGSQEFTNAAVFELGYIPSTVYDIAERPPELTLVPDYATYLTYAFLHSDILHLGGNMLFLWVFGDNVEDALGHFRYLVFYLLCAIAGAFVHGYLAPDSQDPLIGASGAIAGVVTAYLVLHPRVKVWILAFARIPLRVPAYIVLALWILFQFAMFASGGDDKISWGSACWRHHRRRAAGVHPQAARSAGARSRDHDAPRRQGGATERSAPGRGRACAALGTTVGLRR